MKLLISQSVHSNFIDREERHQQNDACFVVLLVFSCQFSWTNSCFFFRDLTHNSITDIDMFLTRFKSLRKL